MNILPLIVRELRREARHPSNYALRTFSATILAGFLFFYLWKQRNSQTGGTAFHLLNLIIFCAIWVVVPLLTADCISREKREWTLGLLFLTPLKPLDIILSKGVIHAIRSVTLLIAGIPILTIPFLLGGVTVMNVFWSVVFHFTALALALAAGLLASSLCRQWTRAIILAEILSALFLLVSFKIVAVSLFGLSAAGMGFFETLRAVFQNFVFAPRAFPAVSFNFTIQIVMTVLAIFGGTILFSGLIVLFAARRLKKTWQENPPSLRQTQIEKLFCTPRFCVAFLRRSNQAKLSRNPIGWLQQYSWSAR
ncbi:MAG: ABC transporter permease, partial [Verrucomicrobiota bacterium]|nr:ABC transporter permease [Verrucomicrobiota bacterium]